MFVKANQDLGETHLFASNKYKVCDTFSLAPINNFFSSYLSMICWTFFLEDVETWSGKIEWCTLIYHESSVEFPSLILLESISQTNTSLLNSFFPLETPAPLIKSSSYHTQRLRAIRSIIHTFYLVNEPRSKTSRLSGLVHSPYLTSLKPRMRFFICTDVWLAGSIFLRTSQLHLNYLIWKCRSLLFY